MNEVNPIIKKLQELYSWSEFYGKNQQFDEFNKIQKEIKEYKEKHNLEHKEEQQ